MSTSAQSAPAAATPSFDVTARVDAVLEADREAILADPGFGQHFTDHMVSID